MPTERPRYTTPSLPTVELLEDKAETLDAIVALLYAHSTSQVRIEFRMPTPPFTPKKPKFALGQTVITSNAQAKLAESQTNVGEYLARHMTGDWGDIDAHDNGVNEDALKTGQEGRLMSVYTDVDGVPFWIITEWDRSVTTVLLPEDY